jgi:hypothetical protein
MPTNLLRNPSFIGGVRRVALPFISGAWANDWDLDWYFKESDAVIGTGTKWTLPEMIVVEYQKQFPEDSHRFDKTDPYVFKCFWNGATGFGWKQTNALPPGRYKLSVPVEPDQWHQLPNGSQVRPSPETSSDWYLASEVYAKIVSGGNVVETDWLDARTTPFGAYTVLSVEIDHEGGELTVGFGARGRWPFRNNGWFFDGLTLEMVSAPTVASPSPSAEPPPDVSGPTMIVIVVYAEDELKANIMRANVAGEAVRLGLTSKIFVEGQ